MSKISLYNFEKNDFDFVVKNNNECAYLFDDYCLNRDSKLYKKYDKKPRKPYGFCNICNCFRKEVSE